MLMFDNEATVIEMLKDVPKRNIALFGSVVYCAKLYLRLTCSFKKHWIDSSRKSDPPPDFYDPKHKLMMEVMRIDDHAFTDKKGHVHNEALRHEGELYRRFFKDIDREDLRIFIIPDTQLSSKDDHNFARYIANFERVFKKHEDKIDLYKTNHPGFKTIFFIFDESSAYRQAPNKKVLKNAKEGQVGIGMPHLFCYDKRFVDIIKESKVDYVVWFAPWKLDRSVVGNVPLPKCAIYEVKKIKESKLLNYNHECMISTEVW